MSAVSELVQTLQRTISAAVDTAAKLRNRQRQLDRVAAAATPPQQQPSAPVAVIVTEDSSGSSLAVQSVTSQDHQLEATAATATGSSVTNGKLTSLTVTEGINSTTVQVHTAR
jgi:hypothetical protein